MTSDIDPILKQYIADGIDTIPDMVELMWPGLPEYEKTTKRTKLHTRLAKMAKYGEVERCDKRPNDTGQLMTVWRLTE